MRFVHIVVLAGGTGGARFLRALRSAAPEAEITAVVNTGDDVTMHGLRICPDLDTVVYTLGGGIDEERGWGRAGESWTVNQTINGTTSCRLDGSRAASLRCRRWLRSSVARPRLIVSVSCPRDKR